MESARRLQEARRTARLTQAELAARAGVSRALVSAVEAGRHLPRVDAALALAQALDTTAAALFGPAPAAAVDALSGEPVAPGAAVRVGCVGSRVVTTPARHGDAGWELVDAVVVGGESGGAARSGILASADPQVVVAGCEPGLRLLERMLQTQGTKALAITSSSAAALAALEAGRLHGAVTHFTAESGPPLLPSRPVVRFGLAAWQVGLAGQRGRRAGWWRAALGGREEVIQREEGAGVQAAFERAVRGTARARRGPIGGPRVDSHLAASRLCRATGLAAVTIEPAAAAAGVDFHPLETHVVELWLATERAGEIGIRRLLDALHAAAFRRTLESVGGYELTSLGRQVA